jgi:hypothetical protein
VICKTTGDSLLDSLPLLDAMSAAAASGGDINVVGNQASRREAFWFVVCTPTGDCSYQIIPLDGPCGGDPHYFPDTIPGIPAEGHYHPFYPAHPSPAGPGTVGSLGRDTLPTICGRPPHSGAAPWPSGPDYNWVDSTNRALPCLPHYVMDGDNIYVIPCGALTPGQRKTGTKKIPRGSGSCRL